MYYPPQSGGWRKVVIVVGVVLGVAGSFALGQALGHPGVPQVMTHHSMTTRMANTAHGALSSASPTPTARPTLPSAAPPQSRPLSDASHRPTHAGHHQGHEHDAAEGGDHHQDGAKHGHGGKDD